MPQVIVGAAISAVFKTGFTAAFWGVFAKTVAIYGAAALVGKALAKNQQSFSAKAKGRSTMFRSSAAPRQVVYGEAMVSGPLVYVANSGEDNKFLHLVMPLAGHEVEAIGEIFLNDKPLSDWDEYQTFNKIRLYYPASSDGVYSVTINNELFTGSTAIVLKNNIDAHADYIASVDINPYGDDPDWLGRPDPFFIIVESAVPVITLNITSGTTGQNYTKLKVLRQGSEAVTITKHLGTANQLADPDLVAAVPEWTTDHRLQSVAYLHVRLAYNREAWPNGVPNIKALVKGKKDIVDPRTGLPGWADNWALCVNDYLRWQYGFNCDATEIDEPALIAAANIADEIVDSRKSILVASFDYGTTTTITTAWPHGLTANDSITFDSWLLGSSPAYAVTVIDELTFTVINALHDHVVTADYIEHTDVVQKRYTINGAFDHGESPIDVLGELQSAGAGASIFQMGRWHIHAGAAVATQPTGLNESDLRGSINFSPKHKRQSLFNAVQGTFIDKNDHYQQTDFPLITNADFELEDGGERIYQDISLPYTDNVYAAQRLANIELINHRQSLTIEFPAKITGLKYAVWDVIPITIAQLGWANKLFRVIDWNLSGVGGPDLILQEYNSNAWTFDAASLATALTAPKSSLADPRNVIAPDNLQLFSGNGQLIQSGDGSILSYVLADWHTKDAHILEDEVRYKKTADVTWSNAGKTTNQQLMIGPLEDGVSYDFAVKTINSLNVSSVWTTTVTHTVIGKTALPGDPLDLTLTVLPDGTRQFYPVIATRPLDLSGYLYRARAGTHATWDALDITNGGLDLHDDPIKASPWETGLIPAGLHTIGVKLIDTTGNESATAKIVTLTLPSDPAQVIAAIEATAATDAQAKADAAEAAALAYTEAWSNQNADVTNYTDYRVSNSQTENSVLTIANPQGASFSGGANTTGAIVILLPQSWTNTMMKMEIDVFNYTTSKSFTAHVGGYNYSSAASWINEFAQIVGNTAANNRIRFGHNGTKCAIVIGDTASVWQYPKISVRNFQAGYSNFTLSRWNDGWDVSVLNNLSGYTFTGDFSDALLDAKSILGQGALATSDRSDLDYEDGADVTDYAAAQATAAAHADAQDVLHDVTAAAYADGIVTAEEARAIADAQAKADAAEAAAIAAALVYTEGWSEENADVTDYNDTRIANANLLPSSQWVVGTSGSQGVFSPNGTTAENSIITAKNANGEFVPVWLCSPDLNNDSGGGWNATLQIDHTKTYRSTVFVKRTGSHDGTMYFGCSNTATLNLNGTTNSNPYFKTGDFPVLDKWYLVVGYIHGSGYTGASSLNGGIYDPETGEQISIGTDFKNSVGATTQKQRAYLFYAALGTAQQQFVDPRFEEINSETVSLEILMSSADSTQAALEAETIITGGGITLDSGG